MGASIDPALYLGKNNFISQTFRTLNDPGGLYASELGLSDKTVFGDAGAQIFDPGKIGDARKLERRQMLESVSAEKRQGTGRSILVDSGV